MSNMNVTGTAPEASAVTEKELQFAKQQAELKSGEALLKGISREVMEQREKIQSSREEEEQKQPKDTARLSETSGRFSSDGTIAAEEALKWEALLEWQPDKDLDLQTQLSQLSNLYLTILESVLKYTPEDALAPLLERLDALLAEKLKLLMEQKLRQLTTLLEESGQTTDLDSIRSSLYRQTAGKSISPQAARTLFASSFSRRASLFEAASHESSQGRARASGAHESGRIYPSSREPGSLNRSGTLSSDRNGMIYQSSGKQNLRFAQAYDTQHHSWKEQLRERQQVISQAKKGISQNTFKPGNYGSFSGRELERANRFAAHLEGSGNLFRNPGISARNEEVTGLLAAVMSMKGQVYARESRQGSSVTLPLQNAMDKIIRQYLSRKGASNVYYHTLSAYEKLQSPLKAIESGQTYAYRLFREKQRNPAYEKSPQYSKESGFFRSMARGISPEKEFAAGAQILEKDWQNFLYAIGGRQASSYLRGTGIHSPWGILADTGNFRAMDHGPLGKLLLGTAVIAIIGTLALLYFRLL